MELKPLKRYKNPKFPEKNVIMKQPDLIRHLSKRWKGNLYTKVLISNFLLLSLVSCTNEGRGRSLKSAIPKDTEYFNFSVTHLKKKVDIMKTYEKLYLSDTMIVDSGQAQGDG